MADREPQEGWRLEDSGNSPEQGGRGLAAAFGDARKAFAGPGGKFLAIVPAALALLIGLAAGQAAGSTTVITASNPANVPQVTSPPTTAPANTAPANTAPATAPASSSAPGSGGGVPATGGQVGTGVVYLANLTPASGAFQSSDTNPVLNGKPQLFPIATDLGAGDYPSKSGDAGYNLGRHYTRFTGLLGIDDNSADSKLSVTVEIQGDGLKLATYTITLGHPSRINLNVTGVLRLDIVWSYSGIASGGAPLVTVVLGDGQLTTTPGYHPTPAASPSG